MMPVTLGFMGKMQQLGVPVAFLHLLTLIMALPGSAANDVHMVEAFAGDHRVTKEFQKVGYAAIHFDIVLNPLQDICESVG